MRQEGADEWNSLLSRASVDSTELSGKTARDLQVFYTGLYRALTFPRRLDEPGDDGPVHWSPYRSGVQQGTLVTDNGFWDTFRTVYPLLALLYPDALQWICRGWLKAYDEGGWIPKWCCLGVVSRRPAAPRRLHAIDACRLREGRSWVLFFSTLKPFGPRRETAMLRAGPRRAIGIAWSAPMGMWS